MKFKYFIDTNLLSSVKIAQTFSAQNSRPVKFKHYNLIHRHSCVHNHTCTSEWHYLLVSPVDVFYRLHHFFQLWTVLIQRLHLAHADRRWGGEGRWKGRGEGEMEREGGREVGRAIDICRDGQMCSPSQVDQPILDLLNSMFCPARVTVTTLKSMCCTCTHMCGKKLA